MPSIRVLPPEVASRIAAGEVVERPASMLKELLENSLDAGASKIVVESKGSGRTSLRIVDDGRGMSREDCELSLQRHATSKIESLEDLDSLLTYGFRGEALYAIAAVSKMTLTSCARGSDKGWTVEVSGGKIVKSRPAPAIPGTTIEVRDLFYNTPARLKFLKSDSFERGRLAAVIEEAALAHPALKLEYRSEGRAALTFEPRTQEARLGQVLGEDLAEGLLPVDVSRGGLRLRLFMSPPGKLVASRAFQYWFVNKRPVSARMLQQALYKAYEGTRTPDRHPVCVGFLDMPGEAFDVNVHPGKREVRFRSDGEIFGLVSGLAASALYKAKAAQPLTNAPKDAPEPEGFYLGGRGFIPGVTAPTASKTAEPDPVFHMAWAPATTLEAPGGAPRWYTPPYRYLGQIERSYLLFEADGGLFVLDQHAAAERILFERYLAEIEKGGARSQKLMLPIPVELPASAAHMVLSHKARLKSLGFELSSRGKTTVQFTAVPALFQKGEDLKELVHRLCDAVSASGAAADVKRDAVATIACKAAVKAHDRLSEKEALKLVDDLKDCADGSCCPHGRRAMLGLTRDELARRFQRPGAPPL